MKHTVLIQVISRAGCRDEIVRELQNIEVYLSNYLRSRVRIVSSCSCCNPQDLSAPEVYVDGMHVLRPSLSTVIDAIQAAAQEEARSPVAVA